MTKFKTNLLPWLIYPATMGLAVCLYLFLLNEGVNLIVSTYLPLTIAGISVTFFEYYLPYKEEWKANKRDVKDDMLFMVTIQLIFTKFLAFFTGFLLLKLVDRYNLAFHSLWPQHLPVIVQGLLMVLIVDFFRYWLHRASHTNKYLWRLHAVHHSPKKLYWLNVGRFHPIERSLQFLIDSFPFMLIGVKQEVLAMYFLFFAVNGFFQHCNIYLRYGFLNYVVSSAELHRWHHSRIIKESDTNFSNTTIIWDIVFGTMFLPKDRSVGELGLLNPNYPLDFSSQMKTPMIGHMDRHDLPLLSFKEIVVNLLLELRMSVLKFTLYLPFKKAAKDPIFYQKELLKQILRRNQDTIFGKKYGFKGIGSYEKFKSSVPVHTYADLQPYIEGQENTKEKWLNAEIPVMYNVTSGTTGVPKYIPVLPSTIDTIKRSQSLFSYAQYHHVPEGFHGKLLGLVSPAIEGHLPSGTAYGSASGMIYKNMPNIAQTKYVLPYEVFEIPDYTIKYYVIMRFALAEKNVTYLGSANPSTFLRMLEIAKEYRLELVDDISSGTIRFLDQVDSRISFALLSKVKPSPERAKELAQVLEGEIDFTSLWPYLKIATTWTGGSCGIALDKLNGKFPQGIKIFELGYLSSEFRGTITIDGDTNAGVASFQDTFFEFVEKEKWEKGDQDFLTLDKIVVGKQYYLFITTQAGLYRYHMNDIVEVTGFFENTPTLQFIQKGKGVTNITGEKLYESQVIEAVRKAEKELGPLFRFYQMLANEEASCYELYLELNSQQEVQHEQLLNHLETSLEELNLEYKAKRSGQRLGPLRLHVLAQGTHDHYKQHFLNKGQRESQFKVILLHYKKDLDFDLSAWTLHP